LRQEELDPQQTCLEDGLAQAGETQGNIGFLNKKPKVNAVNLWHFDIKICVLLSGPLLACVYEQSL